MIMSAAAPAVHPDGGFRASRGCTLPFNPDALLPGALAALLAGVGVDVIVKWRKRGYLPVATDAAGREVRDGRGRPRYRARDVLAAEVTAAQRCELMAGRPAVRSPAGIAA